MAQIIKKKIVKQGFIAEGTTCESCATIIKRQVKKVDGVYDVDFDYASETGYVEFDESKTDIDEILYKIEEKGYSCFLLGNEPKKNKTLGWFFGIIGIIIVGYFLFGLVDGVSLPTISPEMGLGLLFVVGLLTGFHCISMCGGFVISYTAKAAEKKQSPHRSHMMYGAGKLISYTIIGAIFGLLGSLIAFTPALRGAIGLLAGLFLILFGLKMLNIVPWLRKIQFRTPRFLGKFVGKQSSKHNSPLIVGLLNGLMIACGPLQAIYVMAAGTGSMIEGAKFLLVFGLGTLPVMIGFGYFASFVSSKMTQKILKASGVLVIILGVFMLNNGLTLTGTGYDVNSLVASVSAAGPTGNVVSEPLVMKEGFQEIRMDVTRYGWEPDKFVLKKDVPVRWIINGKEINGCNNAIQVPKMDLAFDIQKGEQIIEFTPTEEGIIPWSCWMGMIPGTFIVKDDLDLTEEEIQQELDKVEVPAGGSCGGSSGGCGCGGA